METKSPFVFFRYLFVIVVAWVIAITINGCASTTTSSSTGQFVDDSAVTTKIKSKFVEDPVVGGLRISVETFKGVVQLSGFANSKAEIDQAQLLAKQTEGVRSVRNNIHLK